jgi:uncharacterized protein YaeQ
VIETLDRIASLIGWLVIFAATFFLIAVVLSLLARGSIAVIERAVWRIARIRAVQRWVDTGPPDMTRSDREP